MKNFIALLLLFLAAEGGVRADSSVPNPPAGELRGQLVDRKTGRPLGWAHVVVVELHRGVMADSAGRFYFLRVPAGTYTVRATLLGYAEGTQRIEVYGKDTAHAYIAMEEKPLHTQEIVVEDKHDVHKGKPEIKVQGKQLRENLGTTIAETLAKEPGLDQRTMGMAPARPVLRGLGGDRLLLVEDGERTGDLSATSADHATVLDPLTAGSIDIVRGPAALLYGANVLAGVINVQRNYVPVVQFSHVHGSASAQLQSVNGSYAGAADVSLPIGVFSLRADGSFQRGFDIATPSGNLRNTGVRSSTVSAGASYVQPWGVVGLAGSYYTSAYGIPGGFVGAHPNGVSIALNRWHTELKADVHTEWTIAPRLDVRSTFSRYFHAEHESNGALGMDFGVLTYNASALLHTDSVGILQGGTVGVWSEYRDYATGGLTFTPHTKEYTAAVLLHQKAAIEGVALQGTVRIEHKSVQPQEKLSSTIGLIHRRDFSDIAAALSASYPLGKQGSISLTAMRAFRAPGVEELYTEGPHLAAYSYEIGNPLLHTERSVGVDATVQYNPEHLSITMSLFRNHIAGYIYPRNTGDTNYRVLLPVYQHSGAEALMLGGEASVTWQCTQHMSISGTASYVYGKLVGSNQPLPMMPPLQGTARIQYNTGRFSVSVLLRGASAQERTGEFEERTAGYAVAALMADYSLSVGGLLHTLALSVENLTNTEYRRHLSRVKSIMPEPGRNLKLLYRLYF